jgi:glutamate synthase (NADPH/NADH) small chain
MTTAHETNALSGVAAGLLDAEALAENFSDIHPPLTRHEAMVEADRCYFCYDAPCQDACPTSIDIPLFIREIAADNPLGAARTIFDENIMGGMCARVCPTETLCQEACVREAAEGKPVRIGLLQRYATDAMMETGKNPYARAASSGKRVAIVGAGPAGLSCAHALAVAGHDVTIFEAREKSAGLNEYGIAAYKTPGDFAAKEVAFILSIGGIAVKHGAAFGRDFDLAKLRRDFDAVFLAFGLGATNKLGLASEGDLVNVIDAVDYIAELRQAEDLSKLPVGRRVVVIGGGMTAIDVAVQSKLLGAELVTIVYRRGQDQMKASGYEQDLAQTHGVLIRTWARPVALEGAGDKANAVVFERTRDDGGKLVGAGETFRIEADAVFTAIGQKLDRTASLRDRSAVRGEAWSSAWPLLNEGRIAVDEQRRTAIEGVWAGGDCVDGGQDLTVGAVEDGKQAARSIDAALRSGVKS